MNIQRIIGKKSLILIAKGEQEIASQIFLYDQIREIRCNIEELEVKLLMTNDESYHRVFKVEPNENLKIDECKDIVMKFYNNLLNSSMQLTQEEVENIRKQKEQNDKLLVEKEKK